MTAAEILPMEEGALRIVVAVDDPARRAAVEARVARAGHAVVAREDAADLVLSETVEAGARGLAIHAGPDEGEPAGRLDFAAGSAQIDAALRAVAAGLIVRMPAAETGFRALDEGEGHGLMTPREHEVLAAIGDGLTNKAIARRLGISLHTVKFHIESIFRKLGVRTRTGAIARAAQLGRAQHFEM